MALTRNPLMMRTRAFNVGWNKNEINKTIPGRFVGFNALPKAGLIAHFDESTIEGESTVIGWENQGAGGAPFNLDTVVGTAGNLTRMQNGWARLPGAVGDAVSTPSTALSTIAGDIDIRWTGALDDWTPPAAMALVSKTTVATNAAWELRVNSIGQLDLRLSEDGAAIVSAVIAHTITDGEVVTIRATWGQAQQQAEFWVDGVSLGAPVPLVIAAMFASTAPVVVGGRNQGNQNNMTGYCQSAQVYDGIYTEGTTPGEVFGPELWLQEPTTVDAGWVDNGDGTYTCDGTNGFIGFASPYLTVGKRYAYSMDILERTSGLVSEPYDGTGLIDRGAVGTYTGGFVADFGNLFCLSNQFIGTIGNITFKEIAPDLAVNFNPSQAAESNSPWTDDKTGAEWTPNGDAFVNTTGQDVVNAAGGVGIETAAEQLVSAPNTIFAAVKRTAPNAANQFIMDAASNIPTRQLMALSSTDTYRIFQGSSIDLVGPVDNAPHIVTGEYNADASSKVTASGEGSFTGDAGANDLNFGALFMSSGNTFQLNGWIGEFLVYDRALTENEIAQVQGYLETKWL